MRILLFPPQKKEMKRNLTSRCFLRLLKDEANDSSISGTALSIAAFSINEHANSKLSATIIRIACSEMLCWLKTKRIFAQPSEFCKDNYIANNQYLLHYNHSVKVNSLYVWPY